MIYPIRKLVCFLGLLPIVFNTIQAKNSAVISVDGSEYKVGMFPKELYKKLDLQAGISKDKFSPYSQDVNTSELSFDMLPIKGGVFMMGSPKDDENRAEEELLEHKVKVSDFWMGKHEVTWN